MKLKRRVLAGVQSIEILTGSKSLSGLSCNGNGRDTERLTVTVRRVAAIPVELVWQRA